MSRFHLGTSAAILAMIGAVGTGALAQDQAPAQTETPPAVPAAPAAQTTPDAQALPDALAALNLTDLEIEAGKRGGREIEGDLPGGGDIEAFVDSEGNLVMVEVDDAPMPQSLIDMMLPQTVRDNAILGQFTTIEKLGRFDGQVMIDGEDDTGEDLRAGFDAEGRLLRFGRDDDDGPRFGKGPRRGDHAEHGDHGPRGMEKMREGRGPGMKGPHGGPKWGDDGPRGEHRRGEGPAGGPPPQPPVDQAAIDKVLGDAGYTDLAAPRPAGPRFVLDAVNPSGETVMLEIDPRGDILREVAR